MDYIGEHILVGKIGQALISITFSAALLAAFSFYKASKNKSLKEMFGSGTAVVINPIKSFGYKGTNYKLPNLENPISKVLKDKIMSIQYNLIQDPYGWRISGD